MKKTLFTLPFFVGSFMFAQNTTAAAATTKVETTSNFTDDQKASYYIGMNIANNLKSQGLNVDVDLLARAMKEELTGAKKLLPAEEMNSFMQTFGQKMNEKKAAQDKAESEANKKAGTEFLAKNKLNPSVKTTASGMQYEVIKEGDGKTHPKATDIVKVLYTGKLTNGTVFDSTSNRNNEPAEFPLNQVIKGWTEGIQLMTKGGKYKFYFPADLAYGDRGAGKDVPPGSVLVFDVELLDFKAPELPKTEAAPATKTPAKAVAPKATK